MIAVLSLSRLVYCLLLLLFSTIFFTETSRASLSIEKFLNNVPLANQQALKECLAVADQYANQIAKSISDKSKDLHFQILLQNTNLEIPHGSFDSSRSRIHLHFPTDLTKEINKQKMNHLACVAGVHEMGHLLFDFLMLEGNSQYQEMTWPGLNSLSLKKSSRILILSSAAHELFADAFAALVMNDLKVMALYLKESSTSTPLTIAARDFSSENTWSKEISSEWKTTIADRSFERITPEKNSGRFKELPYLYYAPSRAKIGALLSNIKEKSPKRIMSVQTHLFNVLSKLFSKQFKAIFEKKNFFPNLSEENKHISDHMNECLLSLQGS